MTASARKVPPFSPPVTGGGSAIVIVTWPATTAFAESPLPLYGMWAKAVPVFCLKSSLAIWNGAALDA